MDLPMRREQVEMWSGFIPRASTTSWHEGLIVWARYSLVTLRHLCPNLIDYRGV